MPLLYLWYSLQTPRLWENTCRKVSLPCHGVILLGNANNKHDSASTPAPSHCGGLMGNLSETYAFARLLHGRREGRASPLCSRGGWHGGGHL